MDLDLRRLRSAELGKHKALLAAVMRLASQHEVSGYERALGAPYRLLAEVETSAPAAAVKVLMMPQFGGWADDCLRRMLSQQAGSRAAIGAVPLETDVGHLALFAVTAALRAGVPFRLAVPLRDGIASLPGIGVARPGARDPWEWGLALGDGGGTCSLRSAVGTVAIPADPGLEANPECRPGWQPVLRIVTRAYGACLDVTLDGLDPFLDRYGRPRAPVSAAERETWLRLIRGAWRILARRHGEQAALVAGTVRTVVPLTAPGPTRMQESTEAASFGAIATSRPADALGMAEVLVHETQHAILGARLDAGQLVRDLPGTERFLGYAPWRDDPRPLGALFQGIVAHHGIAVFWQREYRVGPVPRRHRAAVEFGRLRAMTARALAFLAADTPAGSDLLTDAGRALLDSISREVARWLAEPLPVAAMETVADLLTDHEARWRIAHLVADLASVRYLTAAWARGDTPPVAPRLVPTALVPGPLPQPSANARSYLLTLRYRRPGPGAPPVDKAESAAAEDLALVRGADVAAASGYLRRIAAGDDPDAWAGLATVRRRTGPEPSAMLWSSRPELIRALHAAIREAPGTETPGQDLPDRLAAWLTGSKVPRERPRAAL
jgi:HEXXH motif-containing protein